MQTKEKGPKAIKKDIRVPNEDIQIHITGARQDNGNYRLSAYPIIAGVANNNVRCFRTARCYDEIEIICREMVSTILKKLNYEKKVERARNVITDVLVEENPFDIAYMAASNPADYYVDGWGENTAKNALTWFRRNVLPIIRALNGVEDELDIDALLAQIDSNIEKNSRTLIGNIVYDRNGHLRDAQRIYNHMRSINPLLPNLRFTDDVPNKKKLYIEQIKTLDYQLFKLLCSKVDDLIDTNPLLARAIVFMISGGLRTSEAAGTNNSDLIFVESLILIKIRYQEIDGRRNPKLKRPAAYRKVVLDAWGCKRIRLIIARMQELRIEDDGENAPISADKIRSWFSKTIRELGVDLGTLASWRNEMHLDANNRDNDLTAYVLRRCRATSWEIYCGFTKEEIDVLLGHEIYHRSTIDWDSISTYKYLYNKMLRYDIDGIPNTIEYKPSSQGIISLIPHHNSLIVNNTDFDMTVVAHITAREPGRSITVDTEGIVENVNTYSIKNDKGIRKCTELIGCIKEEKDETNKSD